MAAAMVASVKIDGARVEVAPDRGVCLDILVNKAEQLPCGILFADGPPLLPLDAVAQITGSLLPYAVPPSTPQAPPSAFAPIGLRVGDFFWFPRAELDEAYNSNIFATTTSPTYDLITAFTPSFDLTVELSAKRSESARWLLAASLCRPSGAKHSGRRRQCGRTARRDRREFVLRDRTSGAPAHILRVSEFAWQHCSAGNVLGLHCSQQAMGKRGDAFPTKSMSV